jgi:small-conductance mechanosensitive channel
MNTLDERSSDSLYCVSSCLIIRVFFQLIIILNANKRNISKFYYSSFYEAGLIISAVIIIIIIIIILLLFLQIILLLFLLDENSDTCLDLMLLIAQLLQYLYKMSLVSWLLYYFTFMHNDRVTEY